MKLTVRQMYEMRMNGATYQEIADACGLTKQRVNYLLIHYKDALKGMRGKGFNIERIIYKGIYEHFRDNLYESITSFSNKVYGYVGNEPSSIRRFITGKEKRTRFTIQQIKNMCKATGKTFEELFERRDSYVKEEV